MLFKALFLAASSLISITKAQLASGYHLGPLTTSSAKWAVKVCNVLDYGAVADYGTTNTDIGPPLLAAFNACIDGGIVEIPVGSYAMATWVTLSGGKAWGINFEGTIYRKGTAGGTMIGIQDTTDFELYSSRSSGAIQGFGYVFHAAGTYGPRLLRITDASYFSVHDIILVDSPAFHLTLDTCTGGEIYNMIIRGGNEGGLDGIDVWEVAWLPPSALEVSKAKLTQGFNMYIHDVEVTNKDECVTVKNPSNHFLIENIFCNWSGGCAIGSLGDDTDIYEITYNNIYSWECNNMMMIKSDGGNGSVSNSVFSNFIGHNNAYSLFINSYWTDLALQPGNGVLYTGLTFNNWKGDCADGSLRAPIEVICPTTQPCDGIVIEDFAMWTLSGTYEYYKCENAWGSGACLVGGSAHTAVAITTQTITAAPSGYSAATMPGQLSSGLGLKSSIPIPTIPTTFFPGATPATALAYKR